MKFRQRIIKILRWSQKYTNIDMVYLTKGGFWLTSGQIGCSALSLLLSVAFANLVPKEIYGNYRYVLSIVSILAIFTLSGINTAVIRAVARGHESSFIPAIKTRLKWGILGGLASLTIAGYYFLNNGYTLAISFLIAAPFIPLMNSFTVYQSFWTGKKLFDTQIKYTVTIQFFAITTIILTLFITQNIFLILLSYFASYTFLRFIFVVTTLKKINRDEQQNLETISYGKHLSLMGIIEIIANYLDKVVIWYYLGPVSVAIYYFAVSPPRQIEGIIRSIKILALPKFSQYPKEKLKNSVFANILKLLLLITFFTIIYILLAPFIYKILFPQYLNSVAYSRIFAIALIATSGTSLLSISLMAQMKKRELYLAKSIPALIGIVLFLILIPLFGIWGAIYATLIGEFMRFTFYLFLFKKI